MLLLASRTRAWLGRRKLDLLDLVMDLSDTHEHREQATALAAHARSQAEREASALEQEWRRLTALVQQERVTRDAQRRAAHAAREQEMAQLFAQDFSMAVPLGRQAMVTTRPGNGGPTHLTSPVPAGSGSMPEGASGNKSGDSPAPTTMFVTHAQREQAITDAFQKISSATGFSSMEELVANLAALQERNFARFKHLVELQELAENAQREAAFVELEAAAGRQGMTDATAAADKNRAALQVWSIACVALMTVYMREHFLKLILYSP